MVIDREELKRLIDQIPKQDVLQVYDFIGYLNTKREKDDVSSLDISALSEDPDFIRQVQHSREDHEQGRVMEEKSGLNICGQR